MATKNNQVFLLLLLSLVSSLTFADNKNGNTNQILITAGWLENIILEPWNIKLRAQLDTGTKTSSLHALNIKRFKQDGEHWIRFHIEDPVGGYSMEPIERPLDC